LGSLQLSIRLPNGFEGLVCGREGAWKRGNKAKETDGWEGGTYTQDKNVKSAPIIQGLLMKQL